jgi:hypothetical protein
LSHGLFAAAAFQLADSFNAALQTGDQYASETH